MLTPSTLKMTDLVEAQMVASEHGLWVQILALSLAIRSY